MRLIRGGSREEGIEEGGGYLVLVVTNRRSSIISARYSIPYESYKPARGRALGDHSN